MQIMAECNTMLLLNSPFKENLKLRECLIEDLLNDELIKEFGEKAAYHCFEKLETWLYDPPAYTTIRFNTLVTDVDDILTKLNVILTQQNASAASLMVHPVIPDLIIIHCPPVQDKIQPHQCKIIVGSECGSSVLRGANVYAPGVLGATHGVKIGDEVSIYVDIDRNCRRGLAKPFLGRKVFVGNGILMLNRQQLFCVNKPCGLAVKVSQPLYNCLSLRDVLPHEIFLQNLPSVVCSHVLAPRPGDWVLDMCSAPGGKTTHLAILMKDVGHLIALDKSNAKVQKVIKNIQLCNLSCVTAYAFDATKALDITKSVEDSKIIRQSGKFDGPPFPPELFDCILVDAPCSALGQRPQLSNSMTPKELRSYPCLQKKLISMAVKLLQNDGTLVYSTCTWTVAENEGIVRWILDNFSSLELQSQFPHIGGRGISGTGLTLEQLKKLQRFPDLRTLCKDTADFDKDTIAFFIAKFKKKC